MKKGSGTLLFLFALLLCMVIGIFIGRNLSGDYVILSQNNDVNSVQTVTEVRDYRLAINEATKSQLLELPGIGDTIAQRIIDYRDKNGPFQTTDDLLNVEGIGQKKLQAIESLIKVGG